MELQHGIVKWYNPSKGYGFIKRENNKDIFAHHSRLTIPVILKEGMRVEFYISHGIQGLVADRIRIID